MSKVLETQLHSEDETRLVLRCEDGSVHVVQVEPIADDGSRFRVTLPNGQTFTPWSEVEVFGGVRHTWKCHSGHTMARVREYHACTGKPPVDEAGDTLPIRLVLAWLDCRDRARSEGASVRSLMELARAERSRDAQMNSLLSNEPNAAAGFFAKYGGQRTRRF